MFAFILALKSQFDNIYDTVVCKKIPQLNSKRTGGSDEQKCYRSSSDENAQIHSPAGFSACGTTGRERIRVRSFDRCGVK